MANKYRSVLASGGGVQPTGNAQPADVLAGKTFSNADGIDRVGTMVNRGAVSGTATPTQPYTIPAGYHNGSGVINGTGGYSSFTASGGDGNQLLGTNFTVGKSYIVECPRLDTVNSWSGATEIFRHMLDSLKGIAIITATATSISTDNANARANTVYDIELSI